MKHGRMTDLGEAPVPEDWSERRAGIRHLTVYRVARVLTVSDAGLWRVRNMSDRGMLLETDAVVVPNEVLEIALSETIILTGRIVWSGEGRCGVAFRTAIRVGEILRQLVAERESDNYRPLRLPVHCPARLLTAKGEKVIVATSISQFGVGFVHQAELEEGAKVDLALADGVWRRGHIRWLRDGEAGLCLASPFMLPELESVRGLCCEVRRTNGPATQMLTTEPLSDVNGLPGKRHDAGLGSDRPSRGGECAAMDTPQPRCEGSGRTCSRRASARGANRRCAAQSTDANI